MNMNTNNLKNIDYKNIETLKKFLDTNSRIMPRTKTGVNARQQRKITEAVKRARFMGFLPYLSR